MLKIQALQGSEDELIHWAKTQLLVAVVLVGLLGGAAIALVPGIVRWMLSKEIRDAMRAAAEAQAAASQGHEAIRDVRAEAAKYKDEVESLSATARSVDEKFREVMSRIESEGMRASAGADIKISALDKQLNEIRGMVVRLAMESPRDRESVSEHERKLDELRHSAADDEAEFADNSNFRVIVAGHLDSLETMKLADVIASRLSEKGFKASRVVYAPGVPVGKVIRLEHLAPAKRKAGAVRQIVEEAARSSHYPVPDIRVQERPAVLEKSEMNPEIGVFL